MAFIDDAYIMIITAGFRSSHTECDFFHIVIFKRIAFKSKLELLA